MSLKAGIIGLPNVGKSTLFNAITNSHVEAANYPFATISPNTGVVNVINAYRYLGKLLADMYRYDEAIDNYETHIEWLIEKDRDTEQAENELAIIRQHARMMKGTEQVAVIDSVVVNKNDFLQSYKISKPAGKISGNEEGTVYENEMGNKRIYAQKDENGSMKLYTQAKLLDGWSEAEPVTSLNDLGNVNYPFLMGDGTTLYFASDNEDALGGYDIFITRYDSEDNEYLKPSNVGMPFNSTANDYMMVIDEFNNLGWFATDRNQPEDSVCIYVFIPNESKRTYNYENTDLPYAKPKCGHSLKVNHRVVSVLRLLRVN